MRNLFPALLRLYPKSFRAKFAQEMLATFENLRREQANRGSIRRMLFMIREMGGVLRCACAERISIAAYFGPKGSVIAPAGSGASEGSHRNEITELEQLMRFHLSQTIDCIANHKFEGARFHAAEEDRARARLLVLQASNSRGAIGGET